MSKITQAKKEAKAASKELKGKQKKIAEAEAKKEALEEETQQPKQKKAITSIPNYGACVTCTHFPHKIAGEVQPCKITGAYVARKCTTCPKNAYKCKFEG